MNFFRRILKRFTKNNTTQYIQMDGLEYMPTDYTCPECGEQMKPVMYEEDEYTKEWKKTGRKRTACSHLECECGNYELVDKDFMAGEWHE